MKKISTLAMLTLVGLACVVGGNLRAQEDLKTLVYGSDTAAAGTAAGTSTGTAVGPLTVTQIYTNSTSTYTYNFVTDASGVSNYVYVPIGGANAFATDPFTVGSTYTGLNLTSSPFGTPANLELTIPAGGTVPAATTTGVAGMYSLVSENSLTTTSALTDAYTVATATTPNDIEAVQFTFNAPTTQTVTAITGTATITDAVNGDKVDFYRPTGGLSFVAGNTYTVDGFAFAYTTGTEIYDPTIIASTPTVVPEPSSYVLLGFGALGLMLVVRRTRHAKQP